MVVGTVLLAIRIFCTWGPYVWFAPNLLTGTYIWTIVVYTVHVISCETEYIGHTLCESLKICPPKKDRSKKWKQHGPNPIRQTTKWIFGSHFQLDLHFEFLCGHRVHASQLPYHSTIHYIRSLTSDCTSIVLIREANGHFTLTMKLASNDSLLNNPLKRPSPEWHLERHSWKWPPCMTPSELPLNDPLEWPLTIYD